MIRLRHTLIIPLLLALTACQGFTPNFLQSNETLVAQSCEGYRRALGVANDFKPLMSDEQRAAVQVSTEVVPPLCDDAATASQTDAPFDYVAALDRIAAQLAQINSVNGSFDR